MKSKKKRGAATYQEIIARLQEFWMKQGCVILQPYNSEVGAGTLNPATFLRALGPEPWAVESPGQIFPDAIIFQKGTWSFFHHLSGPIVWGLSVPVW